MKARIPVDESLPRACVIGAGVSGIAAAKALYLAGVPFDWFERGSAMEDSFRAKGVSLPAVGRYRVQLGWIVAAFFIAIDVGV